MNRRRTWPAALAAAALTLTGCGIPERVVGLHDAPAEKPAGAVFSVAAAQQVTDRALSAARAAMSADADAAARKAALVGPVLRLAEVPAEYADSTSASALATPPAVTVLGVSKGRGWPRSILATAQQDGVQTLYVLIQRDATTPFKLHTAVPMQPGASVPAVPAVEDGIARVEDGSGLVERPEKVFAAYAALLTYPAKTRSSAVVAADDDFADGLLASSAEQAKALGKLGTLTRTHTVHDEDVIAFRLADGSALAFVQASRHDRLRPTKKAKELVLSAHLAALAGKKKVKKSVDLDWLESFAVVIPRTGKATVIGAGEQLTDLAAA